VGVTTDQDQGRKTLWLRQLLIKCWRTVASTDKHEKSRPPDIYERWEK
jgi:hypothetical protein